MASVTLFVGEGKRAVPIRTRRILAQEADALQEQLVGLERTARLRQPEKLRFGAIPILRPVRAQRVLVTIDVFLDPRIELRLGSQRLVDRDRLRAGLDATKTSAPATPRPPPPGGAPPR